MVLKIKWEILLGRKDIQLFFRANDLTNVKKSSKETNFIKFYMRKIQEEINFLENFSP